jgi:hypothetical protein
LGIWIFWWAGRQQRRTAPSAPPETKHRAAFQNATVLLSPLSQNILMDDFGQKSALTCEEDVTAIFRAARAQSKQ